ncbi:MAG: HAD-IC family P-type ATPase, partial [Pseudomonadota bacterium]
SLTIKKAMRSGFLFKDIDAIEKLSRVDTVVFDKTGTLTHGLLEVTALPLGKPNLEESKIICALESQSEHPVGKALRRFLDTSDSIVLEDFKEIPGRGVSGWYQEAFYQLVASKSGLKKGVQFLKNKELKRVFEFKDSVKREVIPTIDRMRGQNFSLFVLSGDHTDETQRVGRILGFKNEELIPMATPEAKAEFVRSLVTGGKKVLFVGDGINDALAMREATVSISMASSADIAFRSSGIHFLSKGIESLYEAFEYSRRCVWVIFGNLILSFIYNFVFSIFALMGMISPLIAVVLMPLSSLAVVLYTSIGVTHGGVK